ncbi:MAG: hypothetical protein ABI758_00650 [Candidatus Woesebacteria bacterium]
MKEREFKLSRALYVGEPTASPIPIEIEKNPDGSYKLPDIASFETAQEELPERRYLEQGARSFILQSRSLGVKNIGGLVGTLARWNIEKYELIGNMPGLEDGENPIGKTAIQEWIVRLFNAHIRVADSGHDIIKQLHRSDVVDFDQNVVREITEWARIPVPSFFKQSDAYEDIEAYMPVFAVLKKLALDLETEGDNSSDARYQVMSTLLHEVFQQSESFYLGIFVKGFVAMDDYEFEQIYKKYFKENKEKALTKRMYHLFSDFILQTYNALTDDEDPKHLASRQFVTDFIESPAIVGSREEKRQYFGLGAVKRGIMNVVDELVLIKNLYTIAEDTNDSWYFDLAENMKGTVQSVSKVVICSSDQLAALFGEKQEWSTQQWQEIRAFAAELSISDSWVSLAKLDQVHLSVPTDFVTARVKKDDDILFVQLFFIHNEEELEHLSMENSMPFSLTTLAIDLHADHPAIYLRLLDEEAVDESLQAQTLSLIHQLLDNTVRIKNERLYTPTPAENMISRVNSYDVAPMRQKGKAKTERGEHKRQQNYTVVQSLEPQKQQSGKSKTFAEEIREKRLWPEFVFPEDTVRTLREKFNDSDIQRIEQKLLQANKGAGLVKTYPGFDGPRENKTVWAIRLNRQVRILAQEGIESGMAHVFAVEFKSEIEKR